jgi:hypothetical protein
MKINLITQAGNHKKALNCLTVQGFLFIVGLLPCQFFAFAENILERFVFGTFIFKQIPAFENCNQ